MGDKSFIVRARKKSLMTQKDLADKVSTSTATIVAWEKNPDMVSLENLTKIYHSLDNDGRALFIGELNNIFLS